MKARDPAISSESPPGGLLGRVAFFVGAIGLVLATATDSLAVIGRHTGVTFLGSIEIVQSAVVLAASGAIITATLARSHAAVHILTEKLAPIAAKRLASGAAALSALMFLAVALGSGWLLIEGWNGHERTELLLIPFRWLRLVWTGASLVVAILFAAQALRMRSR